MSSVAADALGLQTVATEAHIATSTPASLAVTNVSGGADCERSTPEDITFLQNVFHTDKNGIFDNLTEEIVNILEKGAHDLREQYEVELTEAHFNDARNSLMDYTESIIKSTSEKLNLLVANKEELLKDLLASCVAEMDIRFEHIVEKTKLITIKMLSRVAKAKTKKRKFKLNDL
jgi:hypothetical protein